MKELTKAEEQIMQVLWKIKEGFVKDVIDKLPNPKPAYNTVSTIIRILEKKGFVGHKAFGKSHMYHPAVAKKDYTKSYFRNFLGNYFQNSFQQLVSFFSKENELSVKELEELMQVMQEQLDEKKQKQQGNE